MAAWTARVGVALLVALLLAGCEAPDAGPAAALLVQGAAERGQDGGDAAADPAALVGTQWRLVGGIEGTDPSAPITLVFERAHQLAGSGGCNRYSAALQANGGWRIGPVAATKRGCPGPRGRVEPAYFSALSEVVGARREKDRLVLTRGGAEPLVFEPMPAGMD